MEEKYLTWQDKNSFASAGHYYDMGNMGQELLAQGFSGVENEFVVLATY